KLRQFFPGLRENSPHDFVLYKYKPSLGWVLWAAASQAAEILPHLFVIPSEARNLSFLSWAKTEERFLASLGTTKLTISSAACSDATSRDLKSQAFSPWSPAEFEGPAIYELVLIFRADLAALAGLLDYADKHVFQREASFTRLDHLHSPRFKPFRILANPGGDLAVRDDVQ